eukprot:TRINITY_DN10488_c0_g1_i1.p1 TRINITY_DN10488_c0_g1~~TRINITY_DN10488_c0_g1_i1.p1  ORF type:complete len:600 (-),score=104.40 TRINITY_DN10488_c0_g1_i1:111-1871(-)
MKIIEKINKSLEENSPFFSFEYFPPRTDDGVENLYQRINYMAELNPLFIDVTWGAGGSTSARTLEICKNVQKYIGLETMMHLTCTNMPRTALFDAIASAKEAGIQNILALRGDPPRGEEWKEVEGGFAHASDLIKYIRENWGDYFGIAVAGYPELHSDSFSSEDDVKHLKAKVDAGADFIITQLFYDTSLFLNFVSVCREAGITCPIIPGMMPIQTYAGFSRMTTLCKTSVPEHITNSLSEIKDNDEAVKKYGVELAIQMCLELKKRGVIGFHFYTLNLEKTVWTIIENLGFSEHHCRVLPWRPSAEKGRCKEDVRPIFWNHRHQSYMKRTETWDEFPNGRWGDSRSPAFGEISSFYGAYSRTKEDATQPWAKPLEKIEDVYDVFVSYCKGEINSLPWNELPISSESSDIKQLLTLLNSNGYLTINSQPAVNGVSSSHPIYGWGGSSGWIYQKAYVEFFISEESLLSLLNKLAQGQHTHITYHAINGKGDKSYTNTSGTNALTWGVFTGSEIKQPTVVDSNSFLAWKDEAFGLWRYWAAKYEQNSVSQSLLNQIESSWFLMNIVDNNFQEPTLTTIFDVKHDERDH